MILKPCSKILREPFIYIHAALSLLQLYLAQAAVPTIKYTVTN